MHPAIEISLHLDGICELSGKVWRSLRPRFGPSTCGDSLPLEVFDEGTGRGAAIARQDE